MSGICRISARLDRDHRDFGRRITSLAAGPLPGDGPKKPLWMIWPTITFAQGKRNWSRDSNTRAAGSGGSWQIAKSRNREMVAEH
jgi:hypothetical protein